MDKGLQYKYDAYFIENNRKDNSLKKVRYRKGAIANTVKKYCGLNKKKVVLDIGFGQTDGLITQEIAKNSKKVYGIELDMKDVRASIKKNKQKNCVFMQGDARNLKKFKNETFDIIICTDVIEHIPKNVGKMFAEMNRTLKKDGKIYITLENKFIIKEPHYGLFFLSWLPRSLANLYVRAAKKGKSYEMNHFIYPSFKKICKRYGFDISNITFDLMKNSLNLGYKVSSLVPDTAKELDKLPKMIKEGLFLLVPEWFVVLRKRE